MRASFLGSCATVAGFVTALLLVGGQPPNDGEARTADPVNPVIGDESFIATFGRAPTDDDANLLRVRTHLAYVERLLRSIDDPAMPADLRAARARNLDLLRRYWQAERFPAGENPARRQPTFVDDDGRRCAVAYLVEASAGTSAIDRINRRFRNANIAEMDDPGLDAWIASSGFTRREVMIIQPAYRGRRSPDWQGWSLLGEASALYLNQVAGTDAPNAPRVAGVDARLRLIDLNSRALVGADAAVGSTLSGGTFYRYGLRGGAMPMRAPAVVVTVGGAIDGIEGAVPRAITVPFDLVLSVDTVASDSRNASNVFHELVPWPFVQLHAEAAWVARGRPQTVDWNAGLDLIWRLNRWSNMTEANFSARDLIASFVVTEFAGTLYGGVSLGVGFSGLNKDRSLDPRNAPYW